MSLAIVTGLAAEARIARAPDVATLVGAGRADRLAADLEIAIANGAPRLLSFGVAGALAPRMRPGDLVIAESVRDGARRLTCDPVWRAAISDRLRGLVDNGDFEPGTEAAIRRADIVTVDAPVADPAAKAALFAATGGAAVDMEAAIIARAAARRGLPFAVLRAIADPAHRPLPPAALVAMRADSGVDVAAILGALLREPNQLPALIRLGLDSRRAFSALVRARALLGADFASVDLGDL
jgi:adenosylhomocysteine nucleosidase